MGTAVRQFCSIRSDNWVCSLLARCIVDLGHFASVSLDTHFCLRPQYSVSRHLCVATLSRCSDIYLGQQCGPSTIRELAVFAAHRLSRPDLVLAIPWHWPLFAILNYLSFEPVPVAGRLVVVAASFALRSAASVRPTASFQQHCESPIPVS